MVRTKSSFQSEGPKLYVCSTPIGNLQDVTLRLLEVLKSVDIIAAEDTRHSRKLLSKFDIHGPDLISYHQHNTVSRESLFSEAWAQGKSIALLSDAGTPLISDPGEHAVALAQSLGVAVVPVPGASAVLSALVGSGLPSQPFAFIGFLPREGKKIRQELKRFVNFPGTLIFYEAPHRLKKTLTVIGDVFPNQIAVLARELTKQHEEFAGGLIEELLAHVHQTDIRGEYVILVDNSQCQTSQADNSPADAQFGEEQVGIGNGVTIGGDPIEEAVREVTLRIQEGQSHTAAVREVAEKYGLHRRSLYQITLNNE